MECIWCRYGDKAMEDVLELRRQVLCDEIGFSDSYRLDADDKAALHLLCRQDGQAVCTARIVRTTENTWLFGRLCAPARQRGKGCGAAAVRRAEEKCRRLGGKKITVKAKLDKEGFYSHMGFSSVGEVYLQEEIPHIDMEKCL